MATAGEGFSMTEFLGGITAHGRPASARPLVVRAGELEPLPAGQVHNPSKLAIAGRLPTATFELFRQTIPAGESTDMQRHDHETVHYVISGEGHSEIEDDEVTWTHGDYVYTPPWTWHRHWNDADDQPVEFLTIENSRLLALLGVGRRQSAGLVSMDEARSLKDEDA